MVDHIKANTEVVEVVEEEEVEVRQLTLVTQAGLKMPLTSWGRQYQAPLKRTTLSWQR